jgi:hypothetical protein
MKCPQRKPQKRNNVGRGVATGVNLMLSPMVVKTSKLGGYTAPLPKTYSGTFAAYAPKILATHARRCRYQIGRVRDSLGVQRPITISTFQLRDHRSTLLQPNALVYRRLPASRRALWFSANPSKIHRIETQLRGALSM